MTFLGRGSCPTLSFLLAFVSSTTTVLSFSTGFRLFGRGKTPGREAWTTPHILPSCAAFQYHLEEKQALPDLSPDLLRQCPLEH